MSTTPVELRELLLPIRLESMGRLLTRIRREKPELWKLIVEFAKGKTNVDRDGIAEPDPAQVA